MISGWGNSVQYHTRKFRPVFKPKLETLFEFYQLKACIKFLKCLQSRHVCCAPCFYDTEYFVMF